MEKKVAAPDCQYCGNKSKLVGGDVIYPHRKDLASKKFYNCEPCKAFVGCHPNTVQPLGVLANAELRKAKSATHAVFDPIWQERLQAKKQLDPKYHKGMARGGRYKKLAVLLGIPQSECHIGMFSLELCQRTIEICKAGLLND